MKYYRLKDDVEFLDRWYLGDISNVDNWALMCSIPDVSGWKEIELYQEGCEMDFTLSEVCGVPIVSEKVKN